MKKIILTLTLLIFTNVAYVRNVASDYDNVAHDYDYTNGMWTWDYFEIKGSENHYKFQSNLKEDKDVIEQIENTGVFSYLLFEDNKIVIDEFDKPNHIVDGLLPSHSIGKSFVSYVTGHAICEGYISSVDERLTGWDVIENTLYEDQVLIDLLNMKAGDHKYIGNTVRPRKGNRLKLNYINVNVMDLRNLMELHFQNIKKSKPVYNYSALATNVIMNYVIFKTGDDWEKLLHKVFNEHVGIKDSVYFSKTAGGRYGRYSFYAKRYDYLRIAKAMMDDWSNDTCPGKYLKTIYERRIDKRSIYRDTYGNPSKWRNLKGKNVDNWTKKYGGQFYFNISGISKKRKILGMEGAGGQQILIDLDNKRIIVLNAVENNYNWKKIVHKKIKQK